MGTKEIGAPESAHSLSNQVDFSDKDTKHLADYKIVFDYFSKNTTTMFQCEIETGIPRPYICWYVRGMRKNGDIQIARHGRCPISGYDGVQFLTTDRQHFRPEVKQPFLFDELL